MKGSRLTARSTKWALATLLLAVISVLYAPTIDQGLTWDDHVLVEQDARCKDQILKCFGLPFLPPSPFIDAAPPYYRPLVTASFELAGDAHTQHTLNLLLHVIDALLLFLLLMRYGSSPPRAFGGALVWAAHPRLVEAVAWISGRTDVLCTTFIFGALLLWPDPTTTPEEEKKVRGRAVAAAVLLFCALLTKEIAIAAVVAIGFVSRKQRQRWPLLIVPLLAYAAIRISVVGLRSPPSTLAAGQRAPTVFEAIARYFEMLVRLDQPWSARGAIGVVHWPHVIAGALLVIALSALIYRQQRKLQPIGIVLAGVALLAVVQIVPIGMHGAVTGDRFLYLPLAGILIALAPVRGDRPFLAGLLVALGLAEAWVSRRTVKTWNDELDLWLVVAERADPGNVGPRAALAGIVRDRGAPELACPLYASALKELDATGRHATPAYRRDSENLAACYGIIGRYDDSANLYTATLAEYPRSGRVALGLGYAQLHRLDFRAASAAFARAAELEPSLRPLATKMGEDVEVAEHERGTLDASDRSKRAHYLESVGRSIEAEQEWLAVAKDTTLPLPLRDEALGALLSLGSAKTVREAFTAIGNPRLLVFVEEKELRAKKIDAITPRLRYLAP